MGRTDEACGPAAGRFTWGPGGRGLVWLLCLSLAGCGSFQGRDGPPGGRTLDPDNIPDAVPKVEPLSRYGNPPFYEVNGRRYYTQSRARGHRETGIASWYGPAFHGRYTSSRDVYDMYEMTAAHRTLPLPSYVQVVNLQNGRRAIVRVNDRGPFHDNRVIDLSYAAAVKLRIDGPGTALVEVRALDPSEPIPEPSEPVLVDLAPSGKPPPAVPPRPALAAPPASAVALADLAPAPRPPTAPPTAVPVPAARPGPAVAADRTAAPPPTPPAASGTAGMYLQVGAFASRDNALRLRSRLAGIADTGVKVSETSKDERPVYRVRIGPLAGVDQADQLVASLARIGIEDPRVVVE